MDQLKAQIEDKNDNQAETNHSLSERIDTIWTKSERIEKDFVRTVDMEERLNVFALKRHMEAIDVRLDDFLHKTTFATEKVQLEESIKNVSVTLNDNYPTAESVDEKFKRIEDNIKETYLKKEIFETF